MFCFLWSSGLGVKDSAVLHWLRNCWCSLVVNSFGRFKEARYFSVSGIIRDILFFTDSRSVVLLVMTLSKWLKNIFSYDSMNWSLMALSPTTVGRQGLNFLGKVL